ncbi:MAG: TIGR03564 family F420-dependent LLM class oxidoreductase [Frankia sp.]
MRIGVSLTGPTNADAFETLGAEVRRAVDDGFASAWMSNIFGLDALTALAVVGSQVPGIELGTAVVPTYPRHPAALAQQALTTNLAIGGRLALGIGLSHKIVIEGMYGHSYDRPVRHMDEYLSVLLPLINGENAAFEGETLSAQIGLTIPRPRRPPVLLAALAPRMLKLAGARAEGPVLWMTGPATVRDHIVPTITAAADAAGRPAPRVVCVLPVSVTGDVDGARAEAARAFAVYNRLPSYRAMLDREGAADPGGVAIVGDEDSVTEQIAALARFGVTDFVAGEFAGGDDAARTRALLTKLAVDGVAG